jgi:hypothetical protein
MRALPLTLGALALALTLGCDPAEEAQPSDSGPIIRDVGTADTGPADTGAVDVPAVDVPTVDVPLVDAQTPDAATTDVTDAGAADVPADVNCVSDGGCYACAPSTTAQFLNRCTSASCAPFNDTIRLPLLLPDGGLPPLP